jgi:hypothetical protein
LARKHFSVSLSPMKIAAALVLSLTFAGAAHGQLPVAGEVMERFEMAPDRTVIFEPTDDGKIRILKVTDKDRHAPMPRNPGQVAVAMTYAFEIGAVIEFNSGLPYAFSYRAAANRSGDILGIPSCPVKGDAVSQDQWPEGFKSITIGNLQRIDGPVTCAAPGN